MSLSENSALLLTLNDGTPIPLATQLYQAISTHPESSINHWLESIDDAQLNYLGQLIAASKSTNDERITATGELMAITSIVVCNESGRHISQYEVYTNECIYNESARYTKLLGSLNLFFTVEKLRRLGHASWSGGARLSDLGKGVELKYSEQAKPIIELASKDQGTIVTEHE